MMCISISSWEPRKMYRIAQKSKRVCMKNKCQLQEDTSIWVASQEDMCLYVWNCQFECEICAFGIWACRNDVWVCVCVCVCACVGVWVGDVVVWVCVRVCVCEHMAGVDD